MRHHAIVVTSWRSSIDPAGFSGDPPTIETVHDMARKIAGNLVSDLVDGHMNHYRSFFVAPDGSKEGWAESHAGDDVRAALIRYLDSVRYEDGSSSLDWVEVQFGDDNQETKVTAHSDEPGRRKGR